MNLQRPIFGFPNSPGGTGWFPRPVRPVFNPRRFRVGLQGLGQTDDAATVVDENQIRQSYFDPSMTPWDPAAGDPLATDPLATITVTGHPAKPVWPLLIVIAVAGFLWWGGRE